MEGGHLLGQGSYGCAFTPPLLCKSQKASKNGRVGKITIQKDAKHEIEIANLLRKVPLVKHYILLPDPEYCDPAPISKQTDAEIKDCDAVMRENEYKVDWKEAKQIFIPFGGRAPIGNLILASNIHPKYFPFFDFMKHVLEAGSILATAGIVNYDLHPNNFILDAYNVVRILDLGQAFNAREITEETVDTRWKVLPFGDEKDAPNPLVTNVDPPEITTINAMRNGFGRKEAIENVVSRKEIFQDIEKYLGITQLSAMRQMDSFFLSSQTVLQENWTEFYRLYWTGFDSWAIGCLLLTILKYQLTWNEFLQGEWQSKQSMVILALKGLLHPNPRYRLDCVEALFLFDPNNAWIRQFGKPWLAKRKELREKVPKN